MKISRDPRDTPIHEDGPYATNFNNWVIAKDNIKIPNDEILSADDGGGHGNEGVVLKFVRKDGQIVVDEKGEPKTKEVKGNIVIYGSRTTCPECDSLTQQERLNQPWWYL